MSQTTTSIELTTEPAGPKVTFPEQGSIKPQERNAAAKKGSTAVVFLSTTFVTGISSLLAGIVTVVLPKMVEDLGIPHSLMLWPSSIYALTCGCTLILSGAIADVLGSRFMYLFGCVLQSAFTLACGLAQTPFQLLFFRALAGIAIAFCLPTAVSLITTYFPHGKRRTWAFATMGGGQPVGFSIGLVLGGVLADSSATWRAAFYITSGINSIILIITFFGLPKIQREAPLSWSKLREDIDWIGAILLSCSLGLLSYVLAALTGSVTHIKEPATIVPLFLGIALVPVFAYWVHRQEQLGRPAIIPNSLWRNKIFTSICLNVFFLWGSFNATEALLTFWFQDVQKLSATQSSVRFLPTAVMGLAVQLLMGLIISRVKLGPAVVVAGLLSCIPPILSATMTPTDSYWEYVFPAVMLNAVGPDVLYTASILIVSDAFPERTQALAGGVFNTVAQFGKSFGLGLSSIVASSVSMKLEGQGKSRQYVLAEGYNAAWWFILGSSAVTIFISLWGLRNVPRLGMKRE